MFLSRNKKNNSYPCKIEGKAMIRNRYDYPTPPTRHQFYYIKAGFRGSTLYRQGFLMIFSKCSNIGPSGFQMFTLLDLSTLTYVALGTGRRDSGSHVLVSIIVLRQRPIITKFECSPYEKGNKRCCIPWQASLKTNRPHGCLAHL